MTRLDGWCFDQPRLISVMAGNPDDAALAESDDADVSPLLARLKEALAPTNGTDAKHGNELQRLFPLAKWRSNSRNFNVHCRTTKEGRTVRPLCAAVIYCFNQRQLNPLAPLPNPGVAVAVAVDVVHGDTFSGVGADVPKAAKAKLFKHDQRTLLNSYTSFISIMINIHMTIKLIPPAAALCTSRSLASCTSDWP